MTAIVFALINGVLASVCIAAVVWLLMRVTSNRNWNAATRYAVWWATLLITVTIPAVYIPIQRLPLIHRVSPLPVVQRVQPTAVQIETNSSFSQPAFSREAVSATNLSARRSVFRIPLSSGQWVGWAILAWVMASVFMLARLVCSHKMLERWKRRACLLPSHEARLQNWLACCGTRRRRVRFGVSADITTPVAVGPFRPSILIPARMFDALNEDELNQIGLHEAAHLSRRDDYALIFERILEAIFVFHPVVSWIARQLDLEREIACDDIVVRVTGRPVSYASCLTRVVELAGSASTSHLSASVGAESHIERRVQMLLNTRNTISHLLKPRLVTAIGILGLLVAIAAGLPHFIVLAAPTAALRQEKPRDVSFAPQSPEPSPSLRGGAPPATLERTFIIERSPSRTLMQQPQELALPAAATAPSVWVPVVVTDQLHRYVSGLSKEHFKIFEDDVEQEISQFVVSPEELSVGVVLDVRNPVANSTTAQQMAQEFLRDLSSPAEFFVISKQPSDLTSLLEGVRLGIDKLESAGKRRKVVLIISDASDRLNPDTAEQIAMLTGSSDVSFYAVSLTQRLQAGIIQAAAPSDVTLLDILAEQSGGRHFMTTDSKDIPDIAKVLSVALWNVYLLGYQPSNTSRDGKYRQIRVEILPPKGILRLIAMARPGYVAPAQDR